MILEMRNKGDAKFMKIVQRIFGMLIVFSGIFIWLIASFDLAIYGDKTYSFYEKKYEKYQVTKDLQMEMPDVMYVTDEMMQYLKGHREELSVITTVDGDQIDFFNEQDRLHMKDVQDLFLQGLRLQRYAFALLFVCLVIFLKISKEKRKILCQSYWIALGVFLSLLGILVYLFSQDFTKYFTIFHEIFFTNDLWLFDPATDLMIRMLPEGFFYDISARIVSVFASGLLAFFLASIVIYRRSISRTNRKD